MVAGAVVRVVVDVAQVLAVEARELAVQLGLAGVAAGGRVPGHPHGLSKRTPALEAAMALRRPSSRRGRAARARPIDRRRSAPRQALPARPWRCRVARPRSSPGPGPAPRGVTRAPGPGSPGSPPGSMPCASSSPARRLRLWEASTVATRSPAPAVPVKLRAEAPRASASAWHSSKTRPGGRAGGVGAGRQGCAGRQGRGVLRRAGQLHADQVGARVAMEARPPERRRQQRGEDAVRRGDGHGRAGPDRLAGVGRPAEAGDLPMARAVQHEPRRRRAARGDEALRKHEHADVRRHVGARPSRARPRVPARARPGTRGRPRPSTAPKRS